MTVSSSACARSSATLEIETSRLRISSKQPFPEASLSLIEYVTREDKLRGLKKCKQQCEAEFFVDVYTKVSRILARNDKLAAAEKLLFKFLSYSEKRKRSYVKVGKKNIIKMINQYFSSKIQMNVQNVLLLEFLYDECLVGTESLTLIEKVRSQQNGRQEDDTNLCCCILPQRLALEDLVLRALSAHREQTLLL